MDVFLYIYILILCVYIYTYYVCMYIYICTCICYEQAKPWSFLAGTLRLAMRDIMKLLITRSSSSQPMIAMTAVRSTIKHWPPPSKLLRSRKEANVCLVSKSRWLKGNPQESRKVATTKIVAYIYTIIYIYTIYI
jgi:hypothetical protein